MFRRRLVRLSILIAVCILAAPTAAPGLTLARTGVATNTSGYIVYGYGNYARIYIYPNAVSTIGKKVNSIYLAQASGNCVEAGYYTFPVVGGGEMSRGFSVRATSTGGYAEYWSPVYPSPSTYPDTNIKWAGTGTDVRVYFNQTLYKTWPSTGITSGRGIWGEERASTADNGNGSFRYCQYLNGAGAWAYWPDGRADYSGGQNNDPQIHFVHADIPASHWAHFDY